MRKFIAALSVTAVMLVGSAAPALAHHKPGHQGGPPPRTAEEKCEARGGIFIDLGIVEICLFPNS